MATTKGMTLYFLLSSKYFNQKPLRRQEIDFKSFETQYKRWQKGIELFLCVINLFDLFQKFSFPIYNFRLFRLNVVEYESRFASFTNSSNAAINVIQPTCPLSTLSNAMKNSKRVIAFHNLRTFPEPLYLFLHFPPTPS